MNITDILPQLNSLKEQLSKKLGDKCNPRELNRAFILEAYRKGYRVSLIAAALECRKDDIYAIKRGESLDIDQAKAAREKAGKSRGKRGL